MSSPSVFPKKRFDSDAFLIGIIILVGALTLFFELGAKDLWSGGEDRTAEIVREMLERNDFLVPHIQGNAVLTKPPLLHWTIILSSSLLGLNEFSIRLPSVLATLGTALIIYYFCKKFFGKITGLFAALILITTPRLLWHFRSAQIDILLTFLITTSLYFFYLGYSEEKRKNLHFYLFFVLMGLGVIAKGPVGCLPQILIILIFIIFSKGWRPLNKMPLVRGILAFLIVAVPWYIAVYFRMGGASFAKAFLFEQPLGKYLGFVHEEAPGAIWYYFPRLIVDFFPWSFFLPIGLFYLYKNSRLHKDRTSLFLLIWFAVIFIAFSLLGKKASRYILPLYPAAAIAVGKLWSDLSAGKIKLSLFRNMKASFYFIIVFSIVLFCCSIIFINFIDIKNNPFFSRYLNENDLYIFSLIAETFRNHLVGTNILFSLPIIFILLSFFLLRKKRTIPSFFLIIFASVVFFLAYITIMLPHIDKNKSPRAFCEKLNTIVSKTDELVSYKIMTDSILFYLDRVVVTIPDVVTLHHWFRSPKRVYCFMTEKDFKEAERRIGPRSFILDDSTKISGHKMLIITNKSLNH